VIRINLLAVERKAAKKAGAAFQSGQKLTVACTLILILTGLLLGWRYWTLQRESVDLDKAIADAQQETTRLHSIILQVQQFEQQKAQLQQRVVLIEQLRKGQIGPVHMLDEISRALPPMLWLTELKQDLAADSVVIDGRTTVQTGVSDFVANLEASGYFKKSIDIVNTTTETMATPPGELLRFSIRAQFAPPEAPTKGAAEAPKPKS
jgi:type IV pilus assembly protein PilN